MVHFLKLLRMLKEGTPLEKLKGRYPSSEEAVVSTRMCEAVHKSVLNGKIVLMGL